jgi:hypothetical protein
MVHTSRMGEGVVIDLGDVASADTPEDLLSAPSATARRRRTRGVGTALVALACLALTAATAPQPPLDGGFTVPIVRAWYTYVDDQLYLVSGPQEVTAYSLHDGHQLWRTAVRHEINHLSSGGGPIAVREQGECSTLSRLNPETGAVDWTRTGMIVGEEPGADTIQIIRDVEGGCADGATGDPAGGEIDVANMRRALDVVDPATGTARLSVPIAGDQQWTSGPESTTVAIWDREGHLEERDLTTGATLVRGELPLLANAAGTLGMMMPSPWAFEDAWVVLDPPSLIPGDTNVVIEAYDRRTLAPRWTATLLAPSADVHQYYTLWPCVARVVCAQLGDGAEVFLDLATGQRLSGEGKTSDGLPLGEDWLIRMAPGPNNGDHPVVVLWARRTSQYLFPGWELLTYNQADTDVVVLARPLNAQTEFALFDARTGRLRQLGAAAGTFGSCDLTPDRLLCVDGHVVLHVWPV